MNREQMLKAQPRSYMEGTITKMNDEWIFFDDEDDEAYLLYELAKEGIELCISDTWMHGLLVEEDTVLLNNQLCSLQESQSVRIHKPLQIAYEDFLHELCDDSFFKFANTLKELEYSMYDCMLCHNFLSFQQKDFPASGVNFFIFDNEDMVCSIHHFFVRNDDLTYDRFEFVRADGLKIECK